MIDAIVNILGWTFVVTVLVGFAVGAVYIVLGVLRFIDLGVRGAQFVIDEAIKEFRGGGYNGIQKSNRRG